MTRQKKFHHKPYPSILWDDKRDSEITPFSIEASKRSNTRSKENLSPFTKRILIVDDGPDITFTFKKAS